MATGELRKLSQRMLEKHGILAISVEHSTGTVPVGRCSFRLRIAASHRAEALAAADEFIQLMKRDVPIWKTPIPRTDTLA